MISPHSTGSIDQKLITQIGMTMNQMIRMKFVWQCGLTLANGPMSGATSVNWWSASEVSLPRLAGENLIDNMSCLSCLDLPRIEKVQCEGGWLQYGYKCFRVVHMRLTFDESALMCSKLYKATLPSIHSLEEQRLLIQFFESVNVKNGTEVRPHKTQLSVCLSDSESFNVIDIVV